MNQGPEQLERLIAERLDGTLTAEEQARLDRALAGDPAAAVTARRYECLHKLLSGWRTLHRDIDWEAFAAKIARRVAEDVEQEKDAAVDHLVRESAPMPEVDWDRFKARVSSAVRREAASIAGATAPDPAAAVQIRATPLRWRRTAKWLATVGAPLAAAAAIVIAVWWPGAGHSIAPPHVLPAAPMVFVSLDVPQAAGRIAIQFEETPPGGAGEEYAPASDGVADQPVAVGGMVIAVDSSAAEPLESADEALFY
jgi:hypothetical protein